MFGILDPRIQVSTFPIIFTTAGRSRIFSMGRYLLRKIKLRLVCFQHMLSSVG